MGLSASMWTSVSGLLTHGEKRNVVSNNIANVNTIGYKSQRMDFNDYLYLDKGTTSGPSQVGAGVASYAIIGDFSQGALQSTNSVTDIAIDGSGFFKVRQPNSNQYYYTRAGDFYFNADRQLQNPEGYLLQGWKVDNSGNKISVMDKSVNLGNISNVESAYVGSGTPTDIVLDSWYLNAKRTESVSFTMGLVSGGNDDHKTAAAGENSSLALFNGWDANKAPADPPISSEDYATASNITVYDESGNSHTLTVYFDQVSDVDGLTPGYSVYEYIVTIDPADDMRTSASGGYMNETDSTDSYVNKRAGMLMTGQLIFDSAGNLVGQTAYSYAGGDINDDSNWTTSQFSSNGLPICCINFTGIENGDYVNTTDPSKTECMVEIDFGMRCKSGQTVDPTTTGAAPSDAGTKSLADMGKDSKYSEYQVFYNTYREENATSAACSSFVTQDCSQDGYTSGVLSGTNITTDGVIYGYYDNGETLALYQISLYDFHNEQGLRREGRNLYAATPESGEARQGVPGDNGFGLTRAYNIEGSNVDLSTELVNMITTQRGFQANSKGITTVDTMLEVVINMKR